MLGREDGRLPRRSVPTSCSNARRPTGRPRSQAGLAERGRTDGVDVVLDVVGGDEADRNLRVVRPKGTIVQVGLMGGGAVDGEHRAAARQASCAGSAPCCAAVPLEEKVAISRRFADEVLPLFTSGALRPVIDRRFPLADVAAAHAHMEADANVGKILLDVR